MYNLKIVMYIMQKYNTTIAQKPERSKSSKEFKSPCIVPETLISVRFNKSNMHAIIQGNY